MLLARRVVLRQKAGDHIERQSRWRRARKVIINVCRASSGAAGRAKRWHVYAISGRQLLEYKLTGPCEISIIVAAWRDCERREFRRVNAPAASWRGSTGTIGAP